MNKKEFIKALETSKPLYAYVKYTEHDGGYIKQVKSECINLVKQMDDHILFDVDVNEKSIYIN